MERTAKRWQCICVSCDREYVRQKGESLRRCPLCQLAYKNQTGISNMTHRPMGHNTRNQHKKVHV